MFLEIFLLPTFLLKITIKIIKRENKKDIKDIKIGKIIIDKTKILFTKNIRRLIRIILGIIYNI
jgi:hypothetical protein